MQHASSSEDLHKLHYAIMPTESQRSVSNILCNPWHDELLPKSSSVPNKVLLHKVNVQVLGYRSRVISLNVLLNNVSTLSCETGLGYINA